jgi:hypothetical protein
MYQVAKKINNYKFKHYKVQKSKIMRRMTALILVPCAAYSKLINKLVNDKKPT